MLSGMRIYHSSGSEHALGFGDEKKKKRFFFFEKALGLWGPN
jgi:hypothetical protein